MLVSGIEIMRLGDAGLWLLKILSLGWFCLQLALHPGQAIECQMHGGTVTCQWSQVETVGIFQCQVDDSHTQTEYLWCYSRFWVYGCHGGGDQLLPLFLKWMTCFIRCLAVLKVSGLVLTVEAGWLFLASLECQPWPSEWFYPLVFSIYTTSWGLILQTSGKSSRFCWMLNSCCWWCPVSFQISHGWSGLWLFFSSAFLDFVKEMGSGKDHKQCWIISSTTLAFNSLDVSKTTKMEFLQDYASCGLLSNLGT